MTKKLVKSEQKAQLSTVINHRVDKEEYNPNIHTDKALLRDVWFQYTKEILPQRFTLFHIKRKGDKFFTNSGLVGRGYTSHVLNYTLERYAKSKGEIPAYSQATEKTYYDRTFLIKFVKRILKGSIKILSNKGDKNEF